MKHRFAVALALLASILGNFAAEKTLPPLLGKVAPGSSFDQRLNGFTPKKIKSQIPAKRQRTKNSPCTTN